MEIRKLTSKDIKTLVKLLKNIDADSRKKLSGLFQGDIDKNDKAQMVEVGIAAIQTLAATADDIYAWLADMAGMKPEELDKMPAASLFEIIRAIFKQEDLKSFFGSVSKSMA